MTIRRIIANGGSFDSELGLPAHVDNASDLELTLRVFFRQANPDRGAADGIYRDSGRRYAIARWDDDAWQDFCDRFERICEMVWNKGMFLVPPQNISADLRRALMATGAGASNAWPYISCRLNVERAPEQRGSHVAVRIYRLAMGETRSPRSYVQQRGGRDTGVFDSEDVYGHFDFGDSMFFPAAHEIGHALGLEHPVCSGSQNRCYGRPGTPAHSSTMGSGSELTTREARPWLQRIRLHTNHRTGWTAVFSRPNQPTLEEVLAAPN